MIDISPYKRNKIYCGDNSKLIKSLPDDCIDLTVTSPPYDNLRNYNGYTWDFETLAKELYRVTKSGGVVVWVVGDATINGSETGTSFRQALFFMECGFKLHDTMIYQCNGTGAKGSLKAYWQGFEYMFVLVKGKIKTYNLIEDVRNKYPGKKRSSTHGRETRRERQNIIYPEISKRSNVWLIGPGFMVSASDKIAYNHPAIFPEALARDHIISWSNPGDLIFDPFSGSGTTAKMAEQCQRYYLCFEISQEYIDISEERLKQRPLFTIPN